MKRRAFLRRSIVPVGALSGCLGRATARLHGTPSDEPTAEADLPPYSDWIPNRPYDGEQEVVFTHLEVEMLAALDFDDDEDDEDDESLVDAMPIFELPITAGAATILSLLFAPNRYPFGDVIITGMDDGEPVAGIGTHSVTRVDDLLVFHGTYEPTVVADEYAPVFDPVAEYNGATIYVDPTADDRAFAVSEEAVAIVLGSGGDNAETNGPQPPQALAHTLAQQQRGIGRVVDVSTDGQWLFETAGAASLVFGAWDRLAGGTGPPPAGSNENEDGESTPLEENPVFEAATSIVNTADLTFGPLGEPEGVEGKFVALFPPAEVPDEAALREHIVGVDAVAHEIHIEENRVAVTVYGDEFEEATVLQRSLGASLQG